MTVNVPIDGGGGDFAGAGVAANRREKEDYGYGYGVGRGGEGEAVLAALISQFLTTSTNKRARERHSQRRTLLVVPKWVDL